MTEQVTKTEAEDKVDLTPVFSQWYDDVTNGADYREHEQIVEIFDEFLIITESLDSTDFWLQPYVQSYVTGKIVWGPRFRVTVEYMYDGADLVDHLVRFVSEISRPVSGRVCIITDLDSAETICNVTDGYVDDDTINDLISKVTDV